MLSTTATRAFPASDFMRAIVGEGEAKGTSRHKRKKQRATTFASAVDFAIHDRMTEEQFQNELCHPPTRGTHHGIECLAKRGRELRGEQKITAASEPPTEMPYDITGDLSGLADGSYLMLANVQGATRLKPRFCTYPRSC